MASPYSSGGGGSKFEDRVVAYYLTAILSETRARGVPGKYVVKALTQRAAFGEPLDDLIITGLPDSGEEAKLHLQIKSNLRFTENDAEWVTIVQKAWDTFKSLSISDNDRLGVAVSDYHAKVDKHYQAILNWAEDSVDGKNFLERIEKKDFSHEDKRTFVNTIRQILESYISATVSDNDFWRFLRGFVILHFDFSLRDGSRDSEGATDRLRNYLGDDQIQEAKALWEHLIVKAGEIISTGGGATRETLTSKLQSAGLPTGTSANFWKDIKTIDHESRQALGDIKSDIRGFHLHRPEAYEQVKLALTKSRFILMYGEHGTGKSALLKDIAKEASRTGPIFVLKDNRVHPRGWSAHAHVLSVSNDAHALLREIGAAGEFVLFIDGIDKISDPAAQITINDLVRVIAQHPGLSDWKILATVREQNLENVRTWIARESLQELQEQFVAVPLLSQNELEAVSEHFPRLKALILEPGNTDIILKRPFFLESVLLLAGEENPAELPATEAELLKLWWRLGGSENADPVRSQHRRNVLLDLAERLARTPDEAVSTAGLQPEALGELKSAGILLNKELGHSVVFAHDIYEEWALAELLLRNKSEIIRFLHETGEPSLLERPMQLLGSYILETNPSEWKKLYQKVSTDDISPVWQRSVLISCIESTRAEQLLCKLTGYLTENNYARLKNLLEALQTIDVPHPVLSQEETKKNLTSYGKEEFAKVLRAPKKSVWIRFFGWFMNQPEQIHRNLLPDLLPVFQAWQGTYAGQQTPYCQQIGEIAHSWLLEFEDALYLEQQKTPRKPLNIDFGYQKEKELEKSIRSLFLSSVGDVPQLVTEYIKDHSSPQRKHLFRDEIIYNVVRFAQHVSTTSLVDYISNAFIEHPDRGKDGRDKYSNRQVQNLGIANSSSFYPPDFIQMFYFLLLKKDETGGLHLIRTLCNHAISVWKWAQRTGGQGKRPATPISIQLEFPWGEQTFWGDERVYLWFRGICESPLMGSALMSLEQWALAEIDNGRPFEDVFRIVLEKNESVAALGIAASLCTAYKDKSTNCSLPLVACPHLWQYDCRRLLQDKFKPNEIRYLHYRNQHRQQDIMVLVADLLKNPDNKFCSDEIRQAVHLFILRIYKEWISLLTKEEHSNFLPEPGLYWIKVMAISNKEDQNFWCLNGTGEKIVEILNATFNRKGLSLNTSHQKTIFYTSGILADNGVRGAMPLRRKLVERRL